MVMDIEKTKLSKKRKRIINKKKKLAALIKITDLNNKDREELNHIESQGGAGDTLKTTEMASPNKKQAKDKTEQALAAPEEDQYIPLDSTVGGEGDATLHKKKKKKFKHGEGETKHKSKTWSEPELGDARVPSEEWPQLGSGDNKHKRKKSIEEDVHKERPHKMVKRHSENGHTSPNLSDIVGSFADELAIFKRDLERSKQKKPRNKHRNRKSEATESPENSLPSEVSKEEEITNADTSLPVTTETSEESLPSEIGKDKEKKHKKRKSLPETSEFPEESLPSEITKYEPIQIIRKRDRTSLPETREALLAEISKNKDDPEDVDIPDEDLDELRKLLRERKKQLKEIPTVRLKGTGKEADLELSEARLPILPCDVQNLLLLSQLGADTPRFPRWMEMKKYNRLSKTVVLVVEGVSAYDFMNRESECESLKSTEVKAEMVSPYCYNSNFVEELCAVPLTNEQKKTLEKRFGKEICPEALMTDKVIKVLRSAFSITPVSKTKSEAVEQKISVPSTDKFPRTELLLSVWQLIDEGYPLPYGATELGNRFPDYVMTKDEYAEVTPSSPMWALDCEMCLTRAGSELTRVSVVNEKYETVYESFCMPPNPIRNYLTEFSGITAESLKGVTTTLPDIQRDLRALFPSDVILVGQSLNGDLHALKMMHPYCIDSGVIYNLTGVRRRKSKLAVLAKEFLNWDIQTAGAAGHDSVEDSLAALKLVQHKLTKSIEYGDAVLSGLKAPTLDSKHNDSNAANDSIVSNDSDTPEHKAREFDDLKLEVGPTMATSLFKHFTMKKKTVCVVGLEETLAEYSTFVAAAHKENKQLIHTQTTDSNQQTIEQTMRQCKEHNFTLAHLVLGEEEDITQVDSWFKQLYDSPPFNSLFITILVGSHNTFANGAVLVKVKKPRLKLKTPKSC